MRLTCDGTHAKTRFRLSAKRTSTFKPSGVSVQSTTGSRGVRISGSNAGCTMFRGSVKGTGYPLHSPVSPSLPPPVSHRVSSHFNWSLPPSNPRRQNSDIKEFHTADPKTWNFSSMHLSRYACLHANKNNTGNLTSR